MISLCRGFVITLPQRGKQKTNIFQFLRSNDQVWGLKQLSKFPLFYSGRAKEIN